MDSAEYILAFGRLSDDAARLFHHLCGMADSGLQLQMDGGEVARSFGWSKTKLCRVVAELIGSGLIIKNGSKNPVITIEQPRAKQQQKPKQQPEQKPEPKPEPKAEVYSQDEIEFIDKFVKSANDHLPCKVSSVSERLKRRIIKIYRERGVEVMRQAMIKAQSSKVIQTKFKNLNVYKFIDLFDRIVAGEYDVDFGSKQKGLTAEITTTRKLDQFELKAMRK